MMMIKVIVFMHAILIVAALFFAIKANLPRILLMIVRSKWKAL